MDDMAAYYPPHYPSYYQPTAAPAPPPPPPPGAAHPPYHHLYVPPPPQPPYPTYAPPFVAHAPHDDLRTLFIAGLPEDVKAREIYSLFREFPGYESSHLRQSSQPYAFAVFLDQQSAISAMHELNGMVFDLERGSTLYIDLAKANSRSKRSRTDEEWSGSDKKPRGIFPRGASDSSSGSIHAPGMSNSAYNTIGYPSTQSHANDDARAAKETTSTKSRNTQSAAPCPTLFVASLGPTCTEEELVQVFSRFPGFLKLKMQGTYGAPVAFVDFQDTSCSTSAMNSLQGSVLYSSQGGEGMRLEYAKSRMGMRRKQK